MLRLTQEQHDIINNYYEVVNTKGFSYKGIRNVLRQLRELGVDIQCKLNQNYAALKTELDRIQFNHVIDDTPPREYITTVVRYSRSWYRLIINDSNKFYKSNGKKGLEKDLRLNHAVMAKSSLAVGEHTDTNHYIPYTTGQYNDSTVIHNQITEQQKTDLPNNRERDDASGQQEGGISPEYIAIARERIRKQNQETRQLIKDFRESVREVDEAARRCMGFAFVAGGLTAGLQTQDDGDSIQYLPSNEPRLLNPSDTTTGEYNEQQPISTTDSQPTQLDGDVPASDNGQSGTSEMVHPISDKRSRDSQRTESTTESDTTRRSIRSMEDPGVATRRELAEIKRQSDENYRRAKENNRKIDESIRGIVTATVGFVAAVAGQGNAVEHSSENNDTPKRIDPETVDIDDVEVYDIEDEDIDDEDFDDEDVRQSDEADARGAYADDEPEYSDELLDSLPF